MISQNLFSARKKPSCHSTFGHFTSKDIILLIGFLIEYIRNKGTLVDGPRLQGQRQLLKRVGDLKTIVHNMHKIGLVLGDAKPVNVLVDHEDKLWVIDMNNSYTVQWVDADMRDSKEWNLQGLDRIYRSPPKNPFWIRDFDVTFFLTQEPHSQVSSSLHGGVK